MHRRSLAFFAAGLLLLSGCSPPTESSTVIGTGSVATLSPPTAEQPSLEELLQRVMTGDGTAAFELGAMYQVGDTVSKNLQKAKEYFEQAAQADERRAQFNLGMMYLKGEGVNADPVAARRWFQQADEGGNPRAPYQLALLSYQGLGIEQNFAKAKEYFEKAARLGVPEAQYNLGILFIRGEGVAQDLAQANGWLRLARSYGHEGAKEALAKLEPKLTDELRKAGQIFAEKLTDLVEGGKAIRAAGGE